MAEGILGMTIKKLLLQQSALKAMDSIALSWERQIGNIIHQADPLVELTRETLNNKAIQEPHRWILENAFKSHLKYNLDKLFQIRLLSHDGIELLRVEAAGVIMSLLRQPINFKINLNMNILKLHPADRTQNLANTFSQK